GEYGGGADHLRIRVVEDADTVGDVCFLVDAAAGSTATCDVTVPPEQVLDVRKVAVEDDGPVAAVVGIVADPADRLDVVGSGGATVQPELVPVGRSGAHAFGVPLLVPPTTFVARQADGTELVRTTVGADDEPDPPGDGAGSTTTTTTPEPPPEDRAGALDDGLLERGEEGPAVEIWQARYNEWLAS
ncbi:hypothetical protein B7486_75800, partial [cyanobacterium TDX16]